MSIIYNNKQGMIIRVGSFIALTLLALFGMYRFYYHSFYATTIPEDIPEFWSWLHPQYHITYKSDDISKEATNTPKKRAISKEAWAVHEIPLVQIPIPISPRWFTTIGLCFFFTLLALYFCFRHKRVSDFLIDTESEMRKVSWPTVTEVGASSLVVIIVIVILGVYLFLIDSGLGKLFKIFFLTDQK